MNKKFRAWDKGNKRMRDIEEISWDKDGLMHGRLTEPDMDKNKGETLGRVFLGEPVLVDEGNPNHPEGWLDNYPVMQFTGLLDKNGKEIYEGDIVVVPNQYLYFTYKDDKKEMPAGGKLDGELIPNYRGAVEWIYSMWQVVLYCVNPECRGISHGVNNELNTGYEDGEITRWEIIGNIYKNPELLTQETNHATDRSERYGE